MKFLCAVLVISLAYVSEAVFFRDRFPGKTLADLAECKDNNAVTGYDEAIPTKNKYGTKHAVACAKYCLKQKLAGERKDIETLKNIRASVWGDRKECYCMSGSIVPKYSPTRRQTTACIFKTEEESENEDLIPGETCWEEGKQFMGTTFDTAADGRKCDTWSDDHEPWHYYDDSGKYNADRFDPFYYDMDDDLAKSYCRNYKIDPNGPYCFIGEAESSFTKVAADIRKGNILTTQEHFVYCDIPKCPKNDNNDAVELIPGKTCWKEGEQFMGTTVTTTASGKTCDTWADDSKAWHMYDDEGHWDDSQYNAANNDIEDDTAGNYCRNYKEDPNGPYCFVGAESVNYEHTFREIAINGNILTSQDHFEYCNIPKCP